MMQESCSKYHIKPIVYGTFWSHFSILVPKNANFGQELENEQKSHFLHHGAKRLVNVMVFGYFWRPEMEKVSFGAKFHHFRISGAKMRKVR